MKIRRKLKQFSNSRRSPAEIYGNLQDTVIDMGDSYLVKPADYIIDKIESTKIGETEGVQRYTRSTKNLLYPFRYLKKSKSKK